MRVIEISESGLHFSSFAPVKIRISQCCTIKHIGSLLEESFILKLQAQSSSSKHVSSTSIKRYKKAKHKSYFENFYPQTESDLSDYSKRSRCSFSVLLLHYLSTLNSIQSQYPSLPPNISSSTSLLAEGLFCYRCVTAGLL